MTRILQVQNNTKRMSSYDIIYCQLCNNNHERFWWYCPDCGGCRPSMHYLDGAILNPCLGCGKCGSSSKHWCFKCKVCKVTQKHDVCEQCNDCHPTVCHCTQCNILFQLKLNSQQ